MYVDVNQIVRDMAMVVTSNAANGFCRNKINLMISIFLLSEAAHENLI